MDGPPGLFPELADELQLTAHSNAACERVLGSLRRECLDWLIILGERHLVQVLRSTSTITTGPGRIAPLGLRPPEPQPIPDGGVIVRRQRLHGLINEYSRAA